ncbi:hypothetical protein [Chryseobacterium sp.]|uniref:hypothetical protein n=1 Tax=Chryseobacterium sp. TaxID=1871047 RepID=UPI002627FEA2|nr:hypothetical protein [Chryseobacterium sp.]
MAELEDMTNPQNTQYYGHKAPYPLESNSYHRFLIPNYKNEVPNEGLQLYLINGNVETIIPCEFGIDQGKLFRVTFICFEETQGYFEIRTESGTTVFYSNCVRFIDSTDYDGRKFIRVATQCTYNRNLFSYGDSQHDWMITNLPAYCMGEFEVDEDVKIERTGLKGNSMILGAWTEENVKYSIKAEGDNNILSFIAIHSLNQDFYIDGTKRTRKEKPEIGENSSWINMKFSNVKDKDGLNIILDEDSILKDVFKTALSNDIKTIIYVVDNNRTAIQVKN